MLELRNVYKDYYVNKRPLTALRDLSLVFPAKQFVTILGPSGCGKTTLLNLIGGLDKYTSGDLIINGKSTKLYKDHDWDAYRNHHVGFVFQSYNLIAHLSVLENVEISLTLTGINAAERKERAKQALADVGLTSEFNKRPNQLSGGQMQRVAIARALVNNPNIILADEPTGALDTKTSSQVLDILKEVSKERLVIMVSHNEALAEKYSERIIRMLDGKITSDSHNVDVVGIDQAQTFNKEKGTAMSFVTALKSSYKNILTKKGRTLLTSLAGSLGIIGIGLVAAVSNGFQGYINRMESETMASYPLAIFSQTLEIDKGVQRPSRGEQFPDEEEVFVYDEQDNSNASLSMKRNIINGELIDYVKAMQEDGLTKSVMINYTSQMNVLVEHPNGYVSNVSGSRFNSFTPLPSGAFTQLPGGEDYILEFYDLIGEGAKFPRAKEEVLLVVDTYNRLSMQNLQRLGLINVGDTDVKTVSFETLMGKEYRLFKNDDYYQRANGQYDFVVPDYFSPPTFTKKITKFALPNDTNMYAQEEKALKIHVSGILRPKKGVRFDLVTPGIAYTQALNEYMYTENKDSEIGKAHINNFVYSEPLFSPRDFNADKLFFYSAYAYRNEQAQKATLSTFLSDAKKFGASTNNVTNELMRAMFDEIYSPIESIALFPKDSAGKKAIKERIEAYNAGKSEEDEKFKITLFDAVEVVTDSLATLIDIVSIVLIVFTSISLVVSGFLIGIITYVSVIERTKEIGILRAIGARKKDISRLFNAETFIIGLLAALIGVTTTYLLSIPINLILNNLFPTQNIGAIAFLAPLVALFLIVFNVLLTVIAGLIPSRMAAKKDPVVALRTE